MRNVTKLKEYFFKKFSIEASHHSFAPGRVNLIGEHVDYMGGRVLPAAIDKGISVLATPNDSGQLTVWAFDIDEQVTWSEEVLSGPRPASWQAYVWGVLKELAEQGLAWSSGKVLISGDLPQGSGLSSSAALEVATANYFITSAKQPLVINNIQLTKIAHRTENVHVGTNCGIMDQFISVHGKKDHFISLDCATLDFSYNEMKLSDHSWVLFNSMVSHELGNQYNEIRSDLESAEKKLAKGALISISMESLLASKEQLSQTEFERARYVVGEIERTEQFIDCLKNNDLRKAGQLLSKTHWGLSKDLKVSTAELDYLVTASAKETNCLGGRMMGGGFGGCTINLMKNEGLEACIQTIQKEFENQFNILPEVYPVSLSRGAFTETLI